MTRHSVAVRREGGRGLPPASVQRWAERMLEALELAEDVELSVVLCDDAFILDLNRRFADEDHATDVLAFAAREGPGARTPRGQRARVVLGDVVISLEAARRQAGARGATLADEVTVLLAHGLLHLVGHDHRRAAERRLMRARTSELVAAASRRSRR
jgi:probable rRNA maturation factor